jgi:hypothetical protein
VSGCAQANGELDNLSQLVRSICGCAGGVGLVSQRGVRAGELVVPCFALALRWYGSVSLSLLIGSSRRVFPAPSGQDQGVIASGQLHRCPRRTRSYQDAFYVGHRQGRRRHE